jgi:carbonic anhydrase
MTPFPEPLADRYRRFKHRHFEANMEQYQELATYGQSPDVMIVSCCDSRVDPETIFSAMPGELFVMRNVANLIPPYETGGTYHGVSAAIEFAVLNLRIKHLLIMGHSSCGGIKAALNHEAARQTEAQFISKWMSMLEPARLSVMASHQGASRKDMEKALELEGVKTSLQHLRTFPFLAELENNGKLALHGAHFDIGTGRLTVLNEATGTYYAL